MSCEVLSLSTGATLSLLLKLPPQFAGQFAGHELTSQLRTPKGDLIANLQPEWTDAGAGALRLRADDTVNWPVGEALFDVCFKAPDGTRIYTRSASLHVMRGQTR